MSLSQYFDKNLIWLDAEFNNTDQLFDVIAKKALNLGFVNNDFLLKIKKRESLFPTGLKYENHVIAIPHTDPYTIKKQFVAIVIPKNKLLFHLMDDNEKQEPVDVVFILGLDNSDSQLIALQEIVEYMQNSNKIEKLINCSSIFELLSTFQQKN